MNNTEFLIINEFECFLNTFFQKFYHCEFNFLDTLMKTKFFFRENHMPKRETFSLLRVYHRVHVIFTLAKIFKNNGVLIKKHQFCAYLSKRKMQFIIPVVFS